MEKKTKERINPQETMAVYEALAVPGAPHRLFDSLAGEWTTRTTTWMEPGQPPVMSTGTCRQTMLLGGRYLQQEYAGEMMGKPFEGVNLVGYDNFTKKYQSVWIDSMSTGIYFFEGAADAEGRTITQESRYEDPVRGPMTWRSVMRIVADDAVEYEMFVTPEGGAEEKVMEMTVSRMRQEARKAA